MKVLILEDEIPAYQKLASYLADLYPTSDHEHHWGRSISEGQALLNQHDYDFIISDIQLLDGISFDLFDAHPSNCPIIFCSAHDNYLFKAFDTNGIAYILKPYTKADFRKAIEKYQVLFKSGSYKTLNKNTLHHLKSALHQEYNTYKKRFVIKKPTGIQLLNVTDISLVNASGDFCIATDKSGQRHTISQTLGAVAKQLNPQKFFKINRSELVQIDAITAIESHFKNRLLISLEGHRDKVMTSSSNTAEFRKWLEH